jgi:sRNA-binding protein
MDLPERKRLRVLLAKWTSRLRYVRALRRKDAMRHDLEARPVERVSAEDVLNARHRLYTAG